jgi:phage gp29-like protein
MRTLRAKTNQVTSVRVGTLDLRAYPRPLGSVVTPREILSADSMGRTLDARSDNRRRFGRSLSMDRIETALLLAFRGNMRDITDILSETVDTDPHLGSVVNKRFGSVSSLPFELQPASGFGIDREKATFYAEVVRQQIRNMKSFRQNLGQLAWALFNGRACLEKNWIVLQPGAGPVHPKFGQPSMAVQHMDWIHPRRLSFGPQRELRIQTEAVEPGGNFAASGLSVLDMPDKFVWWMPQLFNEYPEREGLGMRCMYWSFFKRFAARERMILTELFGKPWRIIEIDQDSTAGTTELRDADKIVDALGSTHTARLPRGTKLNVVSPAKSAGDVHQDIIDGADKQNSKLVLGQTGTTDGVPAGLNSSQANVMQNEQLGVLIRDASQLSEVIETMLCDRIIAINFGESEVTHAPSFVLRADLPADRKVELERLKLALDAGLSISQSDAYATSGFSPPEQDAIVIRMEQPPTPPNSPVAPAVRPVVVYPIGKSPHVGEQQPIVPEAGKEAGAQKAGAQVGVVDSASTITVNEDRASRGLPPLSLPDGTEDPRGKLTVKEFNSLLAAAEAEAQQAPAGAPPEEDPLASTLMGIAARRRAPRRLRRQLSDRAYDEGDDDLGVMPSGVTTVVTSSNRRRFELVLASVEDAIASFDLTQGAEQSDKDMTEWEAWCDRNLVHLVKQVETSNGTPDDLLSRGMRELTAETDAWAATFEKAVSTETTALGLTRALVRARADLAVGKFGRALERRKLHAMMLGSLDNAKEIGTIEPVAKDVLPDETTVTLSLEHNPDLITLGVDWVELAKSSEFSKKPFKEALTHFQGLKVLDRSTFEKASAAIKQRSFTVAGVLGDQMLQVLQGDLVKAIESGEDLRMFKARIKPRLEEAGFIGTLKTGLPALGPSHVETVFRTNVMNTYNTGRYVQATQPAVIAAFPVWQIQGVDDTRTRQPHHDAHGKKLLANDSFWQTAYPPFGFSCRCRVVALSKAHLKDVVSGSSLKGLPDEGFTSGRPSLAVG